MHVLLDQTIQALVAFANQIGYFGLFLGMFIESTLIPLPSELVMIPAGISAAQGNMNIYLAILAGVAGNVSGAIFSYYISSYLGRSIIIKFGKYFFVKKEAIIKIENFFKSHGSLSVFIARLIPGARHFISIPAGIAKMDFTKFCLYTTAGSGIWTTVLAFLGFAIGENQQLIHQYLHSIIIGCLVFCAIIILAYTKPKIY